MAKQSSKARRAQLEKLDANTLRTILWAHGGNVDHFCVSESTTYAQLQSGKTHLIAAPMSADERAQTLLMISLYE